MGLAGLAGLCGIPVLISLTSDEGHQESLDETLPKLSAGRSRVAGVSTYVIQEASIVLMTAIGDARALDNILVYWMLDRTDRAPRSPARLGNSPMLRPPRSRLV